jgi:flagellar assembly protein FliH
MRNMSRFTPGEEIGQVSQWNFSAVDNAAIVLEQHDRRMKDEAIHQAGYEAGFTAGHAHAMPEVQRQIEAFTQSEGQELARRFAGIFEVAAAQMEQVEQMAAQGVLDLAVELARQVLRHELSVNPNVVLPVVREALGVLFEDARSARVRLNPEDFDVVQATLDTEFKNLSLALIPDTLVARGGCQIESAGTVVDGTLEKRWSRTIASLGLNASWAEAEND